MKRIKLLMTLFLFTIVLLISAISVNAEENCTENVYECTEWSACSTEGTQMRSCELISVCPNADNDMPLELMDCEYVSQLSLSLECRDFPTLKQRVGCRLDLDKDPPEGLDIAYMPEECIAVLDETGKEECIMRYSDAQSCWNNDYKRTDNCLKEQLDLKNIASRKNSCDGDASCLYSLNDDVDNLAKLRIHELEYRAERMLSKGMLSKDSAIDIISYLEQQKLAFENSPSTSEKIRALSNVMEKWVDFIDGLEE